jgi:hypothetical protein
MNNSVSIVYLIENDITKSELFFESNGYKKQIRDEEFVSNIEPKLINTICNLEVEIIIGIRSSQSIEEYVEIVHSIADKVFIIGDNITTGEAYNTLFKNCTNKFVCILKEHFFMEKEWLQDLLLYQKNILKSGVVSIASDFMSCEFTPMLCSNEENMISVFCPQNEILEVVGAYLFERELLFLIGAFERREDINGYEFLQWQMRCTRLGYHNFYIPTQSCIHFKNQNILMPEKLKLVEESVEEMRKNRNFYIPLDDY